MNTDHARSASSRAFTLLELLAVITIISVLMSLLLSGIHAAQETARRARAKNTGHQIVVAVNSYYAEYSKLPDVGAPAAVPGANPDVIVGEPNGGAVLPNGALFDVLRALDRGANADNKQNPRRTIFFSEKAVPNPDSPKDGFLDRLGTGSAASAANLGSLFDPWGRQFNVILDSNGDNYLQVDDQYVDFAGAPPSGQRPQAQCGAFSLGKDGKLGNNGDNTLRNSDDTASWQ
jgi:prepilin-type N-terminal cleavage/methylation domain-containing protein